MKKDIQKKERSGREEYLKRVNSPSYVKLVKRNVQSLTIYNLYSRNNSMSKQLIRELSKSLADDIKNPIPMLKEIVSD
jgi:hypothetical protein